MSRYRHSCSGAAFGKRVEMVERDITEPERDFLLAGHPHTLALLEDLDEMARLDKEECVPVSSQAKPRPSTST